MVLADVDGVDAEFVGQLGFFDNVADNLCVAQAIAIVVNRHVSKGVETELDFVEIHCAHEARLGR